MTAIPRQVGSAPTGLGRDQVEINRDSDPLFKPKGMPVD